MKGIDSQILNAEDEFAISALNESRRMPTMQSPAASTARTSPALGEMDDLQRYIIDLKQEHRKQIELLTRENRHLQERLESNKMYMARQEFNEGSTPLDLNYNGRLLSGPSTSVQKSMLLELKKRKRLLL